MISGIIAHPVPDIFIMMVEKILRYIFNNEDSKSDKDIKVRSEISIMMSKFILLIMFSLFFILFYSFSKDNKNK